jgi:hypothetical protein
VRCRDITANPAPQLDLALAVCGCLRTTDCPL